MKHLLDRHLAHSHVLSFISLISAPAANALSLPVITIACILSSLSAFSTSSLSWSKSGDESAFSAFGLFRRRMATFLDWDSSDRTSCSDLVAVDDIARYERASVVVAMRVGERMEVSIVEGGGRDMECDVLVGARYIV